jgi:IgGFc binding protein
LIAQLSATTGADSIVGGPLMTLVQPLDQISSDYTFAAVRQQYTSDAAYHHFVDVITDTAATMFLVIDGRMSTVSDYFRNWTSIPHTGLSRAVLRVGTGYHQIYTLTGHPICGKVYGLRQNEVYGFPLGIIARDPGFWTSGALKSLLWWTSPETVVTTNFPAATTMQAAAHGVDFSTSGVTTIINGIHLENQTAAINSVWNGSNITTVDDLEIRRNFSLDISTSLFNVTHPFTKALATTIEPTLNYNDTKASSMSSEDMNMTSNFTSVTEIESQFTTAGGLTMGASLAADFTSQNISNSSSFCCTSGNGTNFTVTHRDMTTLMTTYDGLNRQKIYSALFELLISSTEWRNKSMTTQSLMTQADVINSTDDPTAATGLRNDSVTVGNLNATVSNTSQSVATMTYTDVIPSNTTSTPLTPLSRSGLRCLQTTSTPLTSVRSTQPSPVTQIVQPLVPCARHEVPIISSQQRSQCLLRVNSSQEQHISRQLLSQLLITLLRQAMMPLILPQKCPYLLRLSLEPAAGARLVSL